MGKRRRQKGVVLAAVMAAGCLCLSACSEAALGGKEWQASELVLDMDRQAAAQWQGREIACKVIWLSGGTASVEILAPSLAEGIVYSRDGEGMQCLYGDLSADFPEDALPEGGFAQVLIGVLDAIHTSGSLVAEGGNQFSGWYGNTAFRFSVDSATGSIVTLEVPRYAMQVRFGEQRALPS